MKRYPDSTLWRLLELLNQGEQSYEDLMERLGVSTRQFQRLFNKLRAEEIEIKERQEKESGRKLFSLAVPYQWIDYRVISLTEGEILALTVAAQASGAILDVTPLKRDLHSAFKTLLKELTSQPIALFEPEDEDRIWHFKAAPAVPIRAQIFNTLREMIAERHAVLIDYLSASTGVQSTNRKIHPYLIAVRGGSWILVAYCTRRKEIRDFSIAAISAVTPCDPATDTSVIFHYPDEFNAEEYFSKRFSAVGGDRTYTVRMIAEKKQAEGFRRKKYHPTQEIEQTYDDGRIVVRYEVAGLDEIRCFAQGWGIGVTVIEPLELVEIMGEQARELAGRYQARP